MNNDNESTLVFSLGQDGYDRAWAGAVESQRQYCLKHGYNYHCISEAGSSRLHRENIWLKVLSIVGALSRHKYIMYLDTDVRIQTRCPPFSEAVTEENPIGLVAGHSGRVNAGVIIAQQTPESLAFFKEWLRCLGKPLAIRHDVGWGENGHLIRLAEKHRVPLLDTRWNNTLQPELEDYIRHYTGPMRDQHTFSEAEKAEWEKISARFKKVDPAGSLDILTSFAELKEVYERTIPATLFEEFKTEWIMPEAYALPDPRQPGVYEAQQVKRVIVPEEISDSSPNAYVVTLRDGLHALMPSRDVLLGVNNFWDRKPQRGDVFHIQWIESLFGWKNPTPDEVDAFDRRLREISQVAPIVYTAHNFDLMPSIGALRNSLLRSLANYGTLILHLSEANIDPYKRHHKAIPELGELPTAIVPHGDYQPYFRLPTETFDDPVFKTEKIKILVFGHMRSNDELQFCLDVGKRLDELGYQLVIAGAVNPDVVHWKEVRALIDNWDGGTRRLHLKVPNEKIRSLFLQCHGVLIPRNDRLNSGVQYLAYTLLKPTFVPSENSMAAIQNTVTGSGTFKPNDAESAAQTIVEYFSSSISDRLVKRFQTHHYNYTNMDKVSVGKAHISAYRLALAYQQQKSRS